jgi:hypothetical protein
VFLSDFISREGFWQGTVKELFLVDAIMVSPMPPVWKLTLYSRDGIVMNMGLLCAFAVFARIINNKIRIYFFIKYIGIILAAKYNGAIFNILFINIL